MSQLTPRCDSKYASSAGTPAREGNYFQSAKAVLRSRTSETDTKGDGMRRAVTGVHPFVFQLGLGAVVWFLSVAWLDFAWGRHVDFSLVVVTGVFFIFFSLLLLASSLIAKDPRWSQSKMTITDFIRNDVATSTGKMRGRDALIEVALVPVALAVAATLVGLPWLFLH
jgi:hypothetical protein